MREDTVLPYLSVYTRTARGQFVKKVGKTATYIFLAKTLKRTSCGDPVELTVGRLLRAHDRTHSYDIVGAGEQDFGQFLSEYIQDIA